MLLQSAALVPEFEPHRRGESLTLFAKKNKKGPIADSAFVAWVGAIRRELEEGGLRSSREQYAKHETWCVVVMGGGMRA